MTTNKIPKEIIVEYSEAFKKATNIVGGSFEPAQWMWEHINKKYKLKRRKK